MALKKILWGALALLICFAMNRLLAFYRSGSVEKTAGGLLKTAATLQDAEALQSPAELKASAGLGPEALGGRERRPWEGMVPLNPAEQIEFEAARLAIEKHLSWGKLEASEAAELQQQLFHLGDRAVADVGRKLANLTRDDVNQAEAGARVIDDVDLLGYLAAADFDLAKKIIAHLATRPVHWQESGKLADGIEAQISFELFVLYARDYPERALRFIQDILPPYRPAYFAQYAQGRRLAGQELDTIDTELREAFGSPQLALSQIGRE